MADSRPRDGSNPSIPSPANGTEKFPDVDPPAQSTPSLSPSHERRDRSASGRLRSASLRFLESNPPPGFLIATGTVASKAPTLRDIRRGSSETSQENGEGRSRNSSLLSRPSPTVPSPTPTPATRTSLGFSRPPRISLGQQDVIQEDRGDEDGFPDMVFGRGRLDNQSFDRGNRRPEAIVSDTKLKGVDANLDEDLDEDDEEDEDLEAIRLRRKRNSDQKLAKMFGEAPTASHVVPQPGTKEPSDISVTADRQTPYPNGYIPPPKHTWSQATVIGLKAFWKFTLTPLGFLIVLYGLNVVAWGGMLFLLLCNAAPAMCYPAYLHGRKDCNDLASPRRIWIETDSQILNALFCVTGFGLAPWRFRDLYYLLQYRVRGRKDALRRLAGINRSWFRLEGSQDLPLTKVTLGEKGAEVSSEYRDGKFDDVLPLPLKQAPDPPLTGIRAPPTKLWKLDYVIWAYVANTALQGVLSGFMWGYNRYKRPSWSTGLFVALACIVAAMGGLMAFMEGKRVKKVEGVPVPEAERSRDAVAV